MILQNPPTKIEDYESLNYLSPARYRHKPEIDFLEGSLYLSHKIALVKSKELIAYWVANNKVPDWIDTFQEKAVVEMLALFLRGKNFQLLAGTGTGKTYMMFALIDIVTYYGYLDQLQKLESKIYPFPIVMFTPTSVVEQSNDVKKLFPNVKDKCFVTNYETLRTKKGLGQIWIEDTVVMVDNEPTTIQQWVKNFAPAIVLFDENQKLKNGFTKQTKLCQAYNDLKSSRIVRCIYASASPFTRPIESKTVVLSLMCYLDIDVLLSLFKCKDKEELEKVLLNITLKEQLEIELKHNLPRLNNGNFKHWLDEYICLKENEFAYSPENMERLTDYLATEHQIVMVNEVKFKHKTMNKHVLLTMGLVKKKLYNAAYDNYIKELVKAGQEPPKSRLIQIWIAQTKFRKISEYLRVDDLATIGVEQERKGKNVIIATAYKESQDELYKILTEDLKFPPEKIAIIKGGQTKKARWKNINKFQDEEATILLLMVQAGGVGLSLHNYKPRNKRPRFVLMPPVWSIIDMLQVLGRAHRINSDTTTHQWVVWYKDTIEEDVCCRLKEKSLSMRELMRRKESWSELFVKESDRKSVNLQGLPSTDIEVEGTTVMDDDLNKDESSEDNEDDTEKDDKDFFNLDSQMASKNVTSEDATPIYIETNRTIEMNINKIKELLELEVVNN